MCGYLIKYQISMNLHFIPFFQRRSVLPPRSEHAVDKQTQGQSKGRGEGAAGKDSSGGARKEKKKRERGYIQT